MNWLQGSCLAYGTINVLFGLLGYFNAKSIPSLVAGVGAGALIVFGATLAKSHRSIGYGIVFVVALGILGRFFQKAFVVREVYPAMILAISSIIMLVLLTYGHFTMKNEDKPVDTKA